MSALITLPGRPAPLRIEDPQWPAAHPPPASRRAFAAAHVAALDDGTIDWDSVLCFREHLWAHGFGVAEAMDTAQRGMGLRWSQARELILATAAQAKHLPHPAPALACGAGTDQLDGSGTHSLTEIVAAYTEQAGLVQSAGAQVILMASRALAAAARSAADYLSVYGHLLGLAEQPVILHWLGEAFDPALRGYWGSPDVAGAADTVVELTQRAGDRIDGIKLSVLDPAAEARLRRRLPAGIRLYTGDDVNYADLIKGGPDGHSDALLGTFAAITVPAAAALAALDRGDTTGYDAIIGPTVPLSRTLFEAPTFAYKAGIAFLAWLNGFQPRFAMLGGFQHRRSAEHLTRVFEQAAAAGTLLDPELAADRMAGFLESVGR